MAFRQIIDELHETLAARGWADVRPSYGFVLLAARDGALTPKAITELLGFTKQAASQLVDAMEGDGYLLRSPHPDDARAKVLTITPRGREVLAEVEETYADIEASWATHIGATRVDALRSALTDALAAFFGDELPPVRPTW